MWQCCRRQRRGEVMEKQVVGLMSVHKCGRGCPLMLRERRWGSLLCFGVMSLVWGLILSRLCFRAERGGVVFGHKQNAASLFVPNPHWFNLLNMRKVKPQHKPFKVDTSKKLCSCHSGATFIFKLFVWLHKNGLTRVCVLILVHVSSCESLIRFIREVISCISASTPVMLLLMLTVGLLYRIRGVKQRSGWYCLIKNNIVSEKMEKS